MVSGGMLRRWTPAGYGTARRIGDGPHELLTPPSLLALLRTGWRSDVPLLHPTAGVAAYDP